MMCKQDSPGKQIGAHIKGPVLGQDAVAAAIAVPEEGRVTAHLSVPPVVRDSVGVCWVADH